MTAWLDDTPLPRRFRRAGMRLDEFLSLPSRALVAESRRDRWRHLRSLRRRQNWAVASALARNAVPGRRIIGRRAL